MSSKITKFIFVFISISLFLYIALIHSNSFNISVDYPDQKQYMDAAIKIRTENPWYLGDRNRMPLYPYIMSLFYSPGENANDYFAKGKAINTFISLICVFVIYMVAAKHLKGLNLTGFISVMAFALFVLKANYFQAENLFYTLYFLSFASFIKALKRPSLKNGVIVGVVVAITYLTKATILLGFLLFLGFILLWSTLKAFGKQKSKAKAGIITFLSSLLVFVLVTSPYLVQNKKIYGKYFYNVNTTFYIWYDSIDDAYKATGTAMHGDTAGWPTVPIEMVPSFSKYIDSHSINQIFKRFENGFLRMLLYTMWSYAVVALSFFCLYLFFLSFYSYTQKNRLSKFAKRNKMMFWFIPFFFIAHLLAFSWYAIIDSGPRFILTLFIPAIFLMSILIEKLKDKNNNYSFLFNLLVLIVLFISIKLSIIPIARSVYAGF